MNLETVLRVLLTLGLLIVGGWFTYGGVQLLGLGGSLYYLGAGILMLVSAWFVSQRSAVGVLIYALLSGLTLVWALFEVGFAFWLLLPRLAMPLGILLVMAVWSLLITREGSERSGNAYVGRYQKGALSTLAAGGAALIYAFSISGDFTVNGSINESNSDWWLQTAQTESGASDPTQWRHYGNTQAGTRFVSAAQINASNVRDLEIAWTYQTGVTPENYPGGTTAFAFQATPIKVDDILYVCAGNNAVHALDPETGEPKWVYDPKIETTGVFMFACRGVSYHQDSASSGTESISLAVSEFGSGVAEADDSDLVPALNVATEADSDSRSAQACSSRIITATLDARLIALDAKTGKPCEGFGEVAKFLCLKVWVRPNRDTTWSPLRRRSWETSRWWVVLYSIICR